MITWDNYEEYMMMHADGELQPAEVQELMRFIDQHPQLRQEMADYQRSVLTPDLSQAFAGKDSLMKTEPAKKRIIAFPHWQRYSIAAGIAAIVFISLIRLKESSTNKYMAQTGVTNPVTTHPVSPAAVAQSTDTNPPSTVQPSAPAVANNRAIALKSVHNSTAPLNNNQVNQQPAHRHDVQQQLIAAARQQIAPAAGLAATELQPLTIDKREENIAAVAAPEIVPAAETPAKRSFWDKLPIDEANRKGAENIANAVVNTYERINTLKESITDKSITISIEKKKLVLSF